MDCIETREKILDEIKRELLGPGSEDICRNIEEEIITDSPIERYSIGILYPQKNIVEETKGDDFDKESENEDEDNNFEEQLNEENSIKNKLEEKGYIPKEDMINDLDQEISMANQYLPSSMGMTFFTRKKVDKLKIRIKYAKYRKATVSDCHIRYVGRDFFIGNSIEDYIGREGEFLYLKQKLSKSKARELINRECLNDDYDVTSIIYKLSNQSPDDKNYSGGYVRIPTKINDLNPIHINNSYEKVALDDNLSITISTRNYGDDITSFTVMLINNSMGKKSISNTIFQPEITVLAEDNEGMEFIDIFTASTNHSLGSKADTEELSLDLLYRNKKTYATGHGVSTGQEVYKEKVVKIYTDFMPLYEVSSLDFSIEALSDISDKLLSMKNLSDISEYSKKEKIDLLNKFVEVYIQWINKLEIESESLNDVFKDASDDHIKNCKYAANRIQEGIDLIENDENVYLAFSLMNRALLMQRAHSSIKEERLPNSTELKEIDYSKEKSSWRPFQLAYILMCISSVENPNSEYRDIVDLIWVPTGGGKTEAYLGLSAFTIFLRRLKNPKNGSGTTIIMRYTLRLLAAQQFIRASIMICACELIRQENEKKLGEEEITIGLWIGSAQTPNKNDDAKQELSQLTRKSRGSSELELQKSQYNKFQLLKCPWCGTKLEKEYEGKKEVGEWGYRINKKAKGFELFCPEQECKFELKLPIQVVDEEIYKNPPTLLFATVDKFAMLTWKEEVSSLFALDSDNENLSPELIIQDELHLISGPLGTMVGLYETVIDSMCSYKGVKPKIIASTATIRRAGEQVKGLYNRDVKQFPPPGLTADDSFFVKDIPVEIKPGRLYVGVMPSGKTQVTVEVRIMSAILQRINMLQDIDDKIKDKYWTLVAYFNSIRELGKCSTLLNDDISDNMTRLTKRLSTVKDLRRLYNQRELTSRLGAVDINKTLKDLEVPYVKEPYAYPIDALLATNMISVGVDVSRLNCMLIVGQPKLTSEYIQASSRVGRSDPGIVFTLYNSSKTRDRSHYEQFYKYHQSFYKFVEPTSVTPFSEPARERGLHAVFISMVRHILGLQSEELASNFDRNKKDLEDIKEYIVRRAKQIASSGEYDVEDEIVQELDNIIDWWHEKAEALSGREVLYYSKDSEPHKLIISYDKDIESNEKQTLQSMRNVDRQCKVEIIELVGEKNDK